MATDVRSWRARSAPPRRLTVNPDRPDSAALQPAVDALAAGEVVAFPTDTLYGLAVDPRRSDAAQLLFAVKRRPAGAAVPLIAANASQIELVVRRFTPLARRMADRWWPGPVSIVLDALPGLDPRLVDAAGTVALRVPAHSLARRLADCFNHPITATSANRSGEPPATNAASVVEALGREVSLVVDGGPTAGGPPSTIVDARGDAPTLVREGVVPWDRVLQSLT